MINNIPENATMPPVVVFDFDGTLMEGDAGKELLATLFFQSPHRKIFAGLVFLVLLPWIAFKPKLIFTKVGSLLLWSGTVGKSRKSIVRLINKVALNITKSADKSTQQTEKFPLPSRAFKEGFEELRVRISQGATCVIITGSPRILVQKIIASAAPDIAQDVRIIGSRFSLGFWGVYTKEHCFRERKLKMAHAAGVPAGPWEACYTDSLTDLPLLLNSRQKYLVNASPKLLAQAKIKKLTDFETVKWGLGRNGPRLG